MKDNVNIKYGEEDIVFEVPQSEIKIRMVIAPTVNLFFDQSHKCLKIFTWVKI